MMQYPFAALIIACFVDVAGAQELPPANTAPVVLSEQRTQVWRVFNLNPDCTAADVIVCCSPRPTGHGHELPRAAMNSRGERYPSALCG
jgi:hypothetical protein